MGAEDNLYITEKITVPEEFVNVFSHFYAAENNTLKPVHKTLLPSFQTILVFSFKANASFTSVQGTYVEIDKCLILGPIKQPIHYTLPAGTHILVANFVYDAFYRFFGKAVLSDALPVHPDELVEENCFTNLWYHLKELDTTDKRVAFILDFCTPYLKTPDHTLDQIKGLQEESTALNPIKVVARQTNQSERNIQIKFKKHLGYSVKEINRYQRFLKVIALLEDRILCNQPIDWLDIVNQCNYYDQSQLIHDFKHYLNFSPTRYLTFQQDICRVKPE